MELRGNVLHMTKPSGDFSDTKGCDKGCHCCTIGHTGRPFKVAFGKSIKMELIESIVCGGKACTMAVHLPEKALT